MLWEKVYLCLGMTISGPNMEDVAPETVGQYTGLVDKYGREIIEGDIIERGGKIWVVEYFECYAQFVMTTYTDAGVATSESFRTIPSVWCEIIGNIYDNPELVKSKSQT